MKRYTLEITITEGRDEFWESIKGMKRYTLEITITEGRDEFWESIKGSGVDDVLGEIKQALFDHGFDDENSSVRVVKFEDAASK